LGDDLRLSVSPISADPPSPHLIVRLRNWVGDVVLGIPALQLLESHGYRLHLVGKGWAASLMAGQGWPTQARAAKLSASVAQLKALRAECSRLDSRFSKHENALVLPTSFSSALEMRLAGLRAVGYRQEARGFLLGRSEPITYGGHALVSYWELACRFLRIEQAPPPSIGMKTSAEHEARAEALLRQQGIGEGFVVIVPFAGGTFEKLDKTWPAFPAFTAQLHTRGRDVVACPGPGEESIVRDHHPGVRVLAGVDLGTYAALLRRAALVVSNDTGPGHMAAAVGTPVISVLGPTKPEQWAPWGPSVQIVRKASGGWPELDEVLSCVDARLRLAPAA
jgi:heptosyltransferase-2